MLLLLADGLSNKAVAARLGVSANTVNFHVGTLLYKLDADSRTTAVVHAARAGLLRCCCRSTRRYMEFAVKVQLASVVQVTPASSVTVSVHVPESEPSICLAVPATAQAICSPYCMKELRPSTFAVHSA